MEINGQTKLADILAEYPFMKTGMVEINGKFKMLQTPMGKMMAKKATWPTWLSSSGTSRGTTSAATCRRKRACCCRWPTRSAPAACARQAESS